MCVKLIDWIGCCIYGKWYHAIWLCLDILRDKHSKRRDIREKVRIPSFQCADLYNSEVILQLFSDEIIKTNKSMFVGPSGEEFGFP